MPPKVSWACAGSRKAKKNAKVAAAKMAVILILFVISIPPKEKLSDVKKRCCLAAATMARPEPEL
jgi:hypothetical protein